MVILPGGVTVTLTATGNTFAYPSLQGHTLITGDGATTTAGMRLFDPLGQPLDPATLAIGTATADDQANTPDRSGWFQGALKITDTAGSTALVEMGVRVYVPALSRFLQVDPIEGGGANDYVWPTDPIGSSDLTGKRMIADKSGGSAAGFQCDQRRGGCIVQTAKTNAALANQWAKAATARNKKNWTFAIDAMSNISAVATAVSAVAAVATTVPVMAPIAAPVAVVSGRVAIVAGAGAWLTDCTYHRWDGVCWGQGLTMAMSLAIGGGNATAGSIFGVPTDLVWSYVPNEGRPELE